MKCTILGFVVGAAVAGWGVYAYLGGNGCECGEPAPVVKCDCPDIGRYKLIDRLNTAAAAFYVVFDELEGDIESYEVDIARPEPPVIPETVPDLEPEVDECE